MDGAPLTSEKVGPDGTIVYRAHGEGRATGAWVTDTPPPNQAYVRKELPVDPKWNDATKVSKIRLKPGTVYQKGIAGPQNFPGGVGGGSQIKILNIEDIKAQEVLETFPLSK